MANLCTQILLFLYVPINLGVQIPQGGIAISQPKKTKLKIGTFVILIKYSHLGIRTHEKREVTICGKVVFLRIEADDISSKMTFDENLAICLSLSFGLSITISSLT